MPTRKRSRVSIAQKRARLYAQSRKYGAKWYDWRAWTPTRTAVEMYNWTKNIPGAVLNKYRGWQAERSALNEIYRRQAEADAQLQRQFEIEQRAIKRRQAAIQAKADAEAEKSWDMAMQAKWTPKPIKKKYRQQLAANLVPQGYYGPGTSF